MSSILIRVSGMLRSLVILSIYFSLAACGPNGKHDSTESQAVKKNQIKATNISGPSIYASLAKNPALGWRITRISTQALPQSVRLNDLEPAGLTYLGTKCLKARFAGRGTSCGSILNSSIFYSTELAGIADGIAAGIENIVSLGLVDDNAERIVVLNQDKFGHAIAEALKSAKLYSKENRTEFIQLVAKIEDEYQVFRQKASNLTVAPPEIIDNSGLLGSRSLRKIRGMVVSQHVRLASSLRYNNILFRNGEILSNAMGEALSSLKTDWQFRRAALELELTSVKCTTSGKLEGWNFSVQCPNARPPGQNPLTGVKVTVNSHDYYAPLPYMFEVKNKHIRIAKRGDTIMLNNNTGKFVTIEQIAVYYNGKIPHQFNIEKHSGALSPQAELNFSRKFWDLFNNLIEARYKRFDGVTKKTAKTIPVNFGFAVKYNINGKSYSLYREKNWPLLEWIRG